MSSGPAPTSERVSSSGTAAAPTISPDASAARRRVALVTGMSGAGRSSALRALEDAGYEAVDNLPLSLLPSLIRPDESPAPSRALAIGVDTRTRGFAAASLLATIDRVRVDPELDLRLIFIDCEDEALQRRFTETRRRHPLATDRPLADGIRAERAMLRDLRDHADLVIDTSTLTQAELKRRVQDSLPLEASPGLAVHVVSFAYRNGLPRDADLVFDVRFLANPHYQPNLRALTGRDAPVAEFIARDPGCAGFIDGLTTMLAALLPRYEREGKSYLTIAIGCTGGRHRSVYVAERLVAWLRARGGRCGLLHRDLHVERRREDLGPGAANANGGTTPG
jgi:RNase adapter protein RapZ